MYLEDERITPAIDATLACYRACLGRATSGQGIDAAHHLDLLNECAEVSRETAHRLISGSRDLAGQLSHCEQVSDRCGAACEQIEGMEECGAVCRWCAEACRKLRAER